MNRLAIIVPCFNEEEMLAITTKALSNVVQDLIKKSKISEDSFILYVDDGSSDNTWNMIEDQHKSSKEIFGLKLAGNVGHQNALTAGLAVAKDRADMIISIDADLQDDTHAIEKMVDKFLLGNDIVYGVRNSRKSDSFFKRCSAQGFYKVIRLMGIKTIYNHADFRLMSKRAVEAFLKYEETNLYIRGMIPLLGYQTESVYYDRSERVAGESKYPLKKMLALAFNGITSFSIKPINFIVFLGTVIVICSVLATVYALVSYVSGNIVAGWTSTILSIWFIGGVQLLSIGLIGQYIGKIYMEVKHRPRYHIETLLENKSEMEL